MVSPDRRRMAVNRLMERFGASQRMACRVVGQHRSTQRRATRVVDEAEKTLRRRLREIARDHPRWGWRKAHRISAREGLVVNPKRTRALWRDDRLQRPSPRRAKRRRLADGSARRIRASAPDEVWALDFQFDETTTCRRLKLPNVVDEFTRQCLAIHVDTAIDSERVIAVIQGLVGAHGAPRHLRMDNGPEMVAHGLRDWCRIWGAATRYIEPGSPWETPFVESFNGRLRDELLNVEDFLGLLDARVVIEDWRIEYNSYRPHSALDGLTPDEFAARWAEQHQPEHA